MNDKDLAALKALAEAATPEPWEAVVGETVTIRDVGGQLAIYTHLNTVTGGRRNPDQVAANARLGAALRNAVPKLFLLIEQQAARIAELEARDEYYRRTIDGMNAHYSEAVASPLPAVDLSGLTRAYNSGYKAGHHDTVEAQYTDIDQRDMLTYHADVVAELVADGTIPAAPARDVGGLAEDRIKELAVTYCVSNARMGNVIDLARAIEREVLATKEAEQDTKGIKEQAEAWLAVCATLDELRFGWRFRGCNGMAGAINTIRSLATSPAPSASQEGVPQRVLRIKVDYKPTFSERGWLEVFAQEFTIEGSEGQRFAVHNSVSRIGEYTATHVETGFAIGHGETPEEAVERARERWMTCPPEELALKIIRAKNNTAIAGKRAMLSAAPAPSVTDGDDYA